MFLQFMGLRTVRPTSTAVCRLSGKSLSSQTLCTSQEIKFASGKGFAFAFNQVSATLVIHDVPLSGHSWQIDRGRVNAAL
jgi:hypothetical protein